MKYTKQHLSLEQQAELLLSRGLVADKQKLMECLSNIGYYRLSAYWHPYRVRRDGIIQDEIVPGTTLEQVWLHYRFDRNLRLCLLDAIERIEIALRSRLAYHHTENASPFDYARSSYFPHWKDYDKKLARLGRPAGNKLNAIDFVEHFFNKYGDCHSIMPLWMAMGVTELGFVVHFFEHSEKSVRSRISHEWGLKNKTLLSWLKAINALRNECAHHARVWNRTFRVVPAIPSFTENKLWSCSYSVELGRWIRNVSPSPDQETLFFSSSRTAALIFVCRCIMRHVAPASKWHCRMQELIDSFAAQGVDMTKMGLPPHWKSHPLWRED
ncbi:MAG: Abi family protein [Akkermansia sp.]|nr:Abi family protein [Akkermansia sp.]